MPTHRLSLTRIVDIEGLNLVKTHILWSYPCDFIGINGIVAPSTDFYARRITLRIASELLKQDFHKISWELLIHETTDRMIGASHEILFPEPGTGTDPIFNLSKFS